MFFARRGWLTQAGLYVPAASGGISSTTLNGAVQGNATFTNGDLTVEQTVAANRLVTRATSAVVLTTNDLKFWQDTVNVLSTAGAASTAVGVVNSSYAYGTGSQAGGWIGGGNSANASLGYYDDGSVYINGVVVATIASFAAGDLISSECSRTGNFIRFKVNAGSWSSNLSVAAITGDLYPAVCADRGGAGPAKGKFTADFTTSTGATGGFTTFP